jgi:glycosyltransferase involved in cell wall biosynthesis
MKLPVLVYKSGGTSEGLRPGKSGYLVRRGDVKTFSAKLHELLTNESKRLAMGEEGRKFVKENFSLEALAVRHERFYRGAAEEAQNIIRPR